MALAKIVIATFFAVALAKPLTGPGGQEGSNSMSISGDTRLGHAAAQCGNGQVISCCNAGNSQSTGGLIGSLGDGVLGGNCDSLDVTVLGKIRVTLLLARDEY